MKTNKYTLSVIVVVLFAVVSIITYFVTDQGKTEKIYPVTKVCVSDTQKSLCAQEYVGRTEAEATAHAKKAGFTVRVVQRDSQTFPITDDFGNKRVNFIIRDEKVTRANFY